MDKTIDIIGTLKSKQLDTNERELTVNLALSQILAEPREYDEAVRPFKGQMSDEELEGIIEKGVKAGLYRRDGTKLCRA